MYRMTFEGRLLTFVTYATFLKQRLHPDCFKEKQSMKFLNKISILDIHWCIVLIEKNCPANVNSVKLRTAIFIFVLEA